MEGDPDARDNSRRDPGRRREASTTRPWLSPRSISPRRGLPPEARIAVVGTPCEIQGIRALQARQWRRGSSRVDAIVLTIALMCTKSFDYRKLLLKELRDDRGIDLATLGKIDVIHGRLLARGSRPGTRLSDEPVKDFHGAALKGCDECADFLGVPATSPSAASGATPGSRVSLVRTEAGSERVQA